MGLGKSLYVKPRIVPRKGLGVGLEEFLQQIKKVYTLVSVILSTPRWMQ